MAWKVFHIVGSFIRDFIFFLLLGGNVIFQSYALFKTLQVRNQLYNQCNNVNVFTYGTLTNVALMLVFLPFSSICMYTIRAKHYDPCGIIITLFSISWLVFAGIGYISNYLACKSDDYPLVTSVILLSINSGICIFVLYFGGKHGHRNGKRRRGPVESLEPLSNISSSLPQLVPKLNKFLSLDRSQTQQNQGHPHQNYGWDAGRSNYTTRQYGITRHEPYVNPLYGDSYDHYGWGR